MQFVVRALRCPPPGLPHAVSARFGASGGRIGRAVDCELALPSPDRTISREHLEIRLCDGRFLLRVISRVNGVRVNDGDVAPGCAVVLSDGDRIALGGYVLVAELCGAPPGDVRDPLALFGGTAGGGAVALDELALLAALVPPGQAGAEGAADWLRAGLVEGPPASMGPPTPSWLAPESHDTGADVLDAFLGGAGSRPSGLPAGVLLSPQAQALYRQEDLHVAMPRRGPAAVPEPMEDDVFAALGALDAEALRPLVPTSASSSSAGGDLPGGKPIDVSDAAAMLAVLAHALELLPGELDAAHPAGTIRVVGELLSLAVSGLFQMLEMRAQLNRALRLEPRPAVALDGSNPLQQADSARAALRYLVDLRQHGHGLFLPPAEAVRDALAELRAHQSAMMAGTRAALIAAPGMLAPAAVEGRLGERGALARWLPVLHRARLWSRFVAMHGELEQTAPQRFDRLLARELARAQLEYGGKPRREG